MKSVTASATFLLLSVLASHAQQYKVLYSFSGAQSGDGANPFAGLARNSAGVLYGTTPFGGYSGDPCIGGEQPGCGTVFQLAPDGRGGWSEAVLYAFCQGSGSICNDGSEPQASLVMDAKGNLYGTTAYGGANTGGAVFELSPPNGPGAAWTEAILYNFCSVISGNSCLDGAFPFSPLVFDSAGNLYGTTRAGGSHYDAGTVFELSPGSSGWTESVLYSFCSVGKPPLCRDGSEPYAGVILGKAGILFGAAAYGGSGGNPRASGTLFELVPGSEGWTESTLVDFLLPGGVSPNAQLNFDSSGNLYGPLGGGGPHSDGAVFQYNLTATKLRELYFDGSNGEGPDGSVLLDPHHHGFFGTTVYGGVNNPGSTWNGTAYQISPTGKETILYNFCSQPAPTCVDGANPMGNLVEDSAGNLYGTTESGGAYNLGVVYEITP